MRSRGQPAGLTALFILATWVAAPVVCAQDALGAIDSCVVKLNADVDIGFERDRGALPRSRPPTRRQRLVRVAPTRLEANPVTISPRVACVSFTLSSPGSWRFVPPFAPPGVERLGDILASVDQADRERSGWWPAQKRGLRAVFDRQERTSSDGWLARMIAQSGPSQAIIQLVSYLALALVVLLAGVIVINELRSSGVFAGGGGGVRLACRACGSGEPTPGVHVE